MREAPEWILVGMVKRIHGNDGEMLILPLSEHAEERFQPGSELYLSLKRQEERSKVIITTSRKTDRGPLVRLEGYNGREGVAPLFGANLFIRAASLAELEPGAYYPFQIEGCEVYSGEQRVGEVTALIETPRANPYIAVDPGGEEKSIYIPFVREVIKNVDLDNQRIDIVEGFLG